MFLFNWFRQKPSVENTEVKKNSPVVTNEMCIIQKDEYEALLRRLNNLENMINALPLKPVPPIRSQTPKVIICDSKDYQTPFQIELENKLKTIREKMGASHGFGSSIYTLSNFDDLDNLEQSIIYMNANQIDRPPTPNNISNGNTPTTPTFL